MLDKQIQAQSQDKEAQRQFEKYKEDKRNETDIRVASINANAKLLDKNNTSEDVSQVQDYSTQILNDFKQQEIGVKKDLAENKKQIEQGKLQRLDEQLRLKTRELDLKEKDQETKRYIATVNKN
jgi:RecG-like helicase